MSHDSYQSPLVSRYASKEMSWNFSDNRKFRTWRKLWLELARAEQSLGLNISNEQLAAMEANLSDIDYERAAQEERERRHDVMAHVHTLPPPPPKPRRSSTSVPPAATSPITPNYSGAARWPGYPYCPSWPASSIASPALLKIERPANPRLYPLPASPADHRRQARLPLDPRLGHGSAQPPAPAQRPALRVAGTTGTQGSFLLFDGDHDKVEQLDQMVSNAFGFAKSYAVTGQTYSRKVDCDIFRPWDPWVQRLQNRHRLAPVGQPQGNGRTI